MKPINMAILGAGRIAVKMASTIAGMTSVKPYAVASRDIGKAKEFADKNGIAKAYGSYRDMLGDPEVDLVYVATPHSHHHMHAKLCLEYGKHVLVEKAFTSDAAKARDIIALAREKKLLVTEAMWTRYMPFSKTIREIVDSGAIGKPAALYACLGYTNALWNKRIQRLELAGGALLDLGVYPINFAMMVFGNDIVDATAVCTKLPTGPDAQETMVLTYADNRLATLFASSIASTDRRGIIYGDKGYLVVNNINNPQSAQLFDVDWQPGEKFTSLPQITGFEYEVEAAVKAIREGAIECPEMPHSETIRVLQMMDSFRAKWGIEFPEPEADC
jgi:Predicted dehydrogenases and related proteins